VEEIGIQYSRLEKTTPGVFSNMVSGFDGDPSNLGSNGRSLENKSFTSILPDVPLAIVRIAEYHGHSKEFTM
jgi:hypothetical protein